LVMPDLDLIKQANQGVRAVRRGRSVDLERDRRRLQPMRAILLLICCRSGKRLGVTSMSGCSLPRLLGVRPTTIQILPGCLVVVGDTAEEARRKRTLLDSLVHPDSGIASLSIALGHDASDFGLPRPENRFFSKPKG
jgi:hypothetical protein